ncbi:MAG: hypothetical protein J6V40_05980 [Clostridia bacterium]|nr:hypothetical protein [Clostridia bacterium]
MKYKITVAYNGKSYSGFQIQNNAATIQQSLEEVLSEVVGESIKINASGRTDAGVSAIGQVCDFETSKEVDIKRMLGYANANL